MTSKWNEELMHWITFDYPEQYESVNDILQRIDNILRKAMHHIDDETIYEEIRKELTGE